MKKLSVLFILSISLSTFAQSSNDAEFISENWRKMKFGVFTSVDFNSSVGPNSDELFNYTYAQGFNHSLGFQWLYKFSDNLELGIDPGYSSKNFQIEEACIECTDQREYSYKLRYLQLPIYARIYLANNRLDIYAIAGTNLAYNKFNSETRTNNVGSQAAYLETNANKFIFGLRAGMGINYNLNFRYSLGMDVTYNHFLNPSMDNPNVNTTGISISPALLYKF